MIGIFDSGSGGLTVLKEIKKLSPKADVVYFGDLANAPYGNRSRRELEELTFFGLRRLKELGATEMIAACNSVSVSVNEVLLKKLNIEKEKIIEMVNPFVNTFANKKSKILLTATKATIESEIYQKAFAKFNVKIDVLAIPELVYLIENNFSDKEIEILLNKYFPKIANGNYRYLIFGCTHFPLVEKNFKNIFAKNGLNISLINPAKYVAKEASNSFDLSGSGRLKVLLSKDSDVFKREINKISKKVTYV
jgi:glutamate racemase